jgi:hypothetical protein
VTPTDQFNSLVKTALLNGYKLKPYWKPYMYPDGNVGLWEWELEGIVKETPATELLVRPDFLEALYKGTGADITAKNEMTRVHAQFNPKGLVHEVYVDLKRSV